MAQALSFNVAAIAPPLVLCGVLTFRWSSGSRVRNINRVVIGLGLMLMSLSLLRSFLQSLAADPLLAVVLAALLTWGCHSSVVMVLVVGSLASTHVIGATQTLALVLGANLGGALPTLMHTASFAYPVLRRSRLASSAGADPGRGPA